MSMHVKIYRVILPIVVILFIVPPASPYYQMSNCLFYCKLNVAIANKDILCLYDAAHATYLVTTGDDYCSKSCAEIGSKYGRYLKYPYVIETFSTFKDTEEIQISSVLIKWRTPIVDCNCNKQCCI